MKKLMLFVPVVMLLSACGAPSVEDLMNDPQKLAEINQKCAMLVMQGKDSNTDECKNAEEAMGRMIENAIDHAFKK